MLRLGVILGSIREGRQGEKVANWFLGVAKQRADFEPVLLDVKALDLPPYRYPHHPRMFEDQYPTEAERGWVQAVRSMDAFVMVTPEYNHGYPPSLKNAIDYASSGWHRKPVGFVSYGGPSGGIRVVQQLRQVVVELHMANVRTDVNIPFVFKAFGADGKPTDPFYETRATAMLDELAWWGNALKTARG